MKQKEQRPKKKQQKTHYMFHNKAKFWYLWCYLSKQQHWTSVWILTLLHGNHATLTKHRTWILLQSLPQILLSLLPAKHRDYIHVQHKQTQVCKTKECFIHLKQSQGIMKDQCILIIIFIACPSDPSLPKPLEEVIRINRANLKLRCRDSVYPLVWKMYKTYEEDYL